jgi:hypothetical protein
MNKSITKNVRYDKFNNYCVDSEGKDIKETKMPGIKDLNGCLAQCARNMMDCMAVEYYEKGRDGLNCFHHLKSEHGNRTPAKGSSKKRYKDATCYVRG